MGKRKKQQKYAIYALAVAVMAAGSIDSAAAANWFKMEGVSPVNAPLLNFSGFFIPLYKYMNGTAAENGQIPRFNLVAPQDTSSKSFNILFAHVIPVGHFKIPHLWSPKIPQAGRADYQLTEGFCASRVAASLSR
ncbi:MAG: hypothetical protein WCY91_09230, partial [Acidithiobacillus sp.]